MNERIRELAVQATKHYPATESSGEFSTFDKEKFAELIVRECAKVLEIQGANTGQEQYYYGSSLLEEHFGVEE